MVSKFAIKNAEKAVQEMNLVSTKYLQKKFANGLKPIRTIARNVQKDLSLNVIQLVQICCLT